MGKWSTNLGLGLLRAAVDDQYFDIFKNGLLNEIVQTSANEPLRVICGNDGCY